MMKKRIATVVLMLTAASASAGPPEAGRYMSGYQLLNACETKTTMEFCRGYIAGVVDYLWRLDAVSRIFDPEERDCLPRSESVEITELRAIVVRYVRLHPERISQSSGKIIGHGFYEPSRHLRSGGIRF
jgi:hypothetical protein